MKNRSSSDTETVLSAETCVRQWLNEFTRIAAGRYRFFVCGFITTKNTVFSASFIQDHCRFFNTTLNRTIAKEVSTHIESFVLDLQETVSTIRDEGKAAQETRLAAKKFSLYFAAVFKPLFMRCAARCFTEADGLIFSLRELETLTSEFHTDISTRLKKHKEGLIELLGIQNRISSQAVAASDALTGNSSGESEDTDDSKDRPGTRQTGPACPTTPNGVSLPDYTLVDAFGRGLLGPLEDFYAIADISIRGPLNPTVFPRAFCAPTLRILKNYLIGSDKYKAANSALLKGIAQLCSNGTIPNATMIRTFFASGKLKPYFIGYFLHILNILLNEDKRENFIRRLNASDAFAQIGQDDVFKERHLDMLTNAWARFTHDNLDSVTARRAASAILVKYIPAAYSREDMARLEALKPKQTAGRRKKTGLSSQQEHRPGGS